MERKRKVLGTKNSHCHSLDTPAQQPGWRPCSGPFLTRTLFVPWQKGLSHSCCVATLGWNVVQRVRGHFEMWVSQPWLSSLILTFKSPFRKWKFSPFCFLPSFSEKKPPPWVDGLCWSYGFVLPYTAFVLVQWLAYWWHEDVDIVAKSWGDHKSSQGLFLVRERGDRSTGLCQLGPVLSPAPCVLGHLENLAPRLGFRALTTDTAQWAGSESLLCALFCAGDKKL